MFKDVKKYNKSKFFTSYIIVCILNTSLRWLIVEKTKTVCFGFFVFFELGIEVYIRLRSVQVCWSSPTQEEATAQSPTPFRGNAQMFYFICLPFNNGTCPCKTTTKSCKNHITTWFYFAFFPCFG